MSGGAAADLHAVVEDSRLQGAAGKPFLEQALFRRQCHVGAVWVNALSYIHRNPVKRKLVQRPEDWAWSSAKSYATLTCGVVRIESIYQARQDPKLNLDKALGLPEPPAPGDGTDLS